MQNMVYYYFMETQFNTAVELISELEARRGYLFAYAVNNRMRRVQQVEAVIYSLRACVLMMIDEVMLVEDVERLCEEVRVKIFG